MEGSLHSKNALQDYIGLASSEVPSLLHSDMNGVHSMLTSLPQTHMRTLDSQRHTWHKDGLHRIYQPSQRYVDNGSLGWRVQGPCFTGPTPITLCRISSDRHTVYKLKTYRMRSPKPLPCRPVARVVQSVVKLLHRVKIRSRSATGRRENAGERSA